VQFLDVIETATFDVPVKINWYVARSFDASPMFTPSGTDTMSYVKLPRFAMFAFISPRNNKEEDWNGTQVMKQGTIGTKQIVSTTRVGEFFLGRAKALETAPTRLTARQKEKMAQQAKTDPMMSLDSDSYRVHLADRKMRAKASRDVAAFEVKSRDRNKACPCGSGLKAKKCHGAP
jgi:hypothetical protein